MIYAIGDIHGARDKVACLIERLRPKEQDRLVFLGDYIDYGPESAAVIDYLIDLPVPSHFLMGNHESMLLDFLGQSGAEVGRGDIYLDKGGIATLRSYGLEPDHARFEDLPESHQRFLRGLRTAHREPGFIFVHGGLSESGWAEVSPERALATSSALDRMWDRSTPTRAHSLNATVVYGHTVDPSRQVRWNLPYSVGIDTGTAFGGPLTALCLDDLRVIQAA